MLRSSVISLIDLMGEQEMWYDHMYDLAAESMAWKPKKAVTWAAVLLFHAAQWDLLDFAREELSMFSTFGNNRVTVRVVQHQVEMLGLTSVKWRRPPPTWTTARAAASAFLSEYLRAGTTPLSLFPQPSLLASFLSFASPSVLLSPSMKHVCVAFFILLVVPAQISSVLVEVGRRLNEAFVREAW